MSTRRGAASRRAVPGARRWPVGALLIGGIALAFVVAFVVIVVLDVREQAASTPPSGVRSFSNLSRNHTEGAVNYPQSPPVGGDHNPVPQNCGYYSKPVRDENAVHSMEHGAVWITYRPGLPEGQVETLRDLAQSNNYVLVSPYPGLLVPVMASAWGKQLGLESANDPRLEQFVSAYQQGPQTPEPGASCSGGVGSPG